MSGDILKELDTVASFRSNMPHIAYYIAGCARQSTNLSPVVLLQFLDKFYSMDSRQVIGSDSERNIESKIYTGDLGSAQKMMKGIDRDYELQTEKKYKEIEELMLLKLESERYTCALCNHPGEKDFMIKSDNCEHVYHSSCYDIYSDEGNTYCAVDGCMKVIKKRPGFRIGLYDKDECSECGTMYPSGTYCFKCEPHPTAFCLSCGMLNNTHFKTFLKCVYCSTEFCSICGSSFSSCGCSEIAISND